MSAAASHLGGQGTTALTGDTLRFALVALTIVVNFWRASSDLRITGDLLGSVARYRKSVRSSPTASLACGLDFRGRTIRGRTKGVPLATQKRDSGPVGDSAGERAPGAVRRYDILDTPPDGAFDRVAALAARVFDVPIATVTIVDEDRIWFKAAVGLDATEISREPGLCASAILQDDPFVVTDAVLDPRTLDNSLVRGALKLRFYAAAPCRIRSIPPLPYRQSTACTTCSANWLGNRAPSRGSSGLSLRPLVVRPP